MIDEVQKISNSVYVLGAGFSRASGFPLQSEIMDFLFDETSYIKDITEQLPSQLIARIKSVKQFCKTVFPGQDIGAQALEDIFTLLDQVIEARGHFANYNLVELINIRANWIFLLRSLFQAFSKRRKTCTNNPYVLFAQSLSKQSATHSKTETVVISLNWDSLFEDSIFEGLSKSLGENKAFVDYGVQTVPVSKDVPSGACTSRIMVLKMHGSVTWMRCPNSNLLYTNVGLSPEKAFLSCLECNDSPLTKQYIDSRECDCHPKLEPVLITPTFSKVFDQPHIQLTWHNAFVALRKATEVTFIGYSLPDADYHFKTLIRRAIRPDVPVRVVLSEQDRPSVNGSSAEEHSRTVMRYINLFGHDRLNNTIRYDGFEGFVEDLARN